MYTISYKTRNVLRLEMSICLDEEVFIYPVFFKGTTSVDYQMATFLLNEKEDTDASLRNLEPEQFDFDNSLDTQAEDFDVNIPVRAWETRTMRKATPRLLVGNFPFSRAMVGEAM